MKTNIRVNNTTHEISVDSRLTLLDALRDVLDLTGTKKGCDQGACGALRSSLTASVRTDLQRHDLSLPGREVIQVRVDFDPGYVAPMHTHPGEEIIYVIEGTLEYEIGGKKSRVKAGDVLFVPAGTPHTATNIGSDTGAELATYVVEKGKPLITLVK